MGSDPAAGWPIQAPGVHPVHCELFWDGQALWIADIRQVGGVFLDGVRIEDWHQIQGPAEIRFGQASLDIETSAPVAQQMVSNPSHARPVTVTDMVAPPDNARPSAPLFGGAAGDDSVPDLEAAKTRVAMHSPLQGERTQIASPSAAALGHSRDGGSLGAMRPRLGGSAGAPHADEATRMVAISMPSEPHQPAMGGAPMGGRPMPPMIGSPAAVVAPPPPPPGHPAMAPPQQPLSSAPPGSAPHLDALQPPDPASPFAAPPTRTEADNKKENFFQKLLAKRQAAAAAAEGAPDAPVPGKDPKAALPLRTWILLSVTVLFTVGWLLWPEDAPEPDPAAQQQAQLAAQEARAAAEALEAAAAQEALEAEQAAQAAARAAAAAAQAAAAQAALGTDGEPSPPAEEESTEAEEGPTLQRRAADAYRFDRHAEALGLYRQLVEQFPEDAGYAAVVRILEREQRRRCRESGGGEGCEEP